MRGDAKVDQPEKTQELLDRLRGGDVTAWHDLIELQHRWLKQEIHGILVTNPGLRRGFETGDALGQLVLNTLRRTPVEVNDVAHLRRLLIKMINQTLIDGTRWDGRSKRDRKREQRLPTRMTVLYSGDDRPVFVSSGSSVEDAIFQKEMEPHVEVALGAIWPSEKRAIELYIKKGMSFLEIGRLEGVSAEGARKRYVSGIRRLEKILGASGNEVG